MAFPEIGLMFFLSDLLVLDETSSDLSEFALIVMEVEEIVTWLDFPFVDETKSFSLYYFSILT